MKEKTARDVKTQYGTFHFELVDYPGTSPLVSITFGSDHLGWYDYFDINEATDMELLEFVINADLY